MIQSIHKGVRKTIILKKKDESELAQPLCHSSTCMVFSSILLLETWLQLPPSDMLGTSIANVPVGQLLL